MTSTLLTSCVYDCCMHSLMQLQKYSSLSSLRSLVTSSETANATTACTLLLQSGTCSRDLRTWKHTWACKGRVWAHLHRAVGDFHGERVLLHHGAPQLQRTTINDLTSSTDAPTELPWGVTNHCPVLKTSKRTAEKRLSYHEKSID